MSYASYYLQARDFADQIRAGTYQVRPKPETGETKIGGGYAEGLMKSRKPVVEEVKPNYEEMILDYMSSFKSSVSDDGLEASASAIGMIESSNNYNSIGPVMEKGWAKGYSAHGKYGVMEPNICPWTKAATGVCLTPKQFIADHAAQEAVLRWKLSKEYKKHGSWEEAASIWFTGKTIAKAGNVDDGHITVSTYLERFRGYYADYSAEPTGFMTRGRPR